MKQLQLKSDISKLHGVLGKNLYESAYSWIIEMAQNATDIHRKCGKSDEFFDIGLDKDEKGYFYYQRDYGTGLNKEDFEKYMCTILESSKAETKTDDEIQEIGKYGLGKISMCAYNSKWEYYSYHNGKVFHAMLEDTQYEGIHYSIGEETESSEPSGIYFKIYHNAEHGNLENLANEVLSKLCYFENVRYSTSTYIPNHITTDFIKANTNVIYRHEDFQYSPQSIDSYLHICLDQYSYPIDWNRLGIEPIYAGIGLRFNLDELEPTPNREKLKIKSDYNELIFNKIRLLSTFIVEEYNKMDVFTYDNLKEYYEQKDIRRPVNIHGINYHIDSFKKYSSVKPNKPIFNCPDFIENIDDFKDEYSRMGNFFHNKAVIYNGTIKRTNLKNYYSGEHLFSKTEDIPKDIIKYLKHIRGKYIIKTINREGIAYHLANNKQITTQEFDYLLDKYMDENLKLLSSIEIPTETKAKLSVKKLVQRKEKYEIGLIYASPRKIWDGFKSASFVNEHILTEEKMKVSPKLTVYSDDEIKLQVLYNLGYHDVALVKTAQLKKLKSIGKMHNFIELEQFINEKHSKLIKILTADRIRRELEEYNNLLYLRHLIRLHLKSKLIEDVETIEKYISNYPDGKSMNNDFANQLRELANDVGLLDKSIWGMWEITKKDLDRFDFVRVFSKISSPFEISVMQEVAKYRKIKLDYKHYPKVADKNPDTETHNIIPTDEIKAPF